VEQKQRVEAPVCEHGAEGAKNEQAEQKQEEEEKVSKKLLIVSIKNLCTFSDKLPYSAMKVWATPCVA
jgi:hypothetical protein